MKWVKTAIGAVIAIMSIGIIATSVYSMTQERVKDGVVTFEVLTENTVTSGTYDLINQLALLDENTVVTNIKSIELNNTTEPQPTISVSYGEVAIGSGNYNDFILQTDDTINSDGYVIQVGDVWVLTFEVTTPPMVSGVTATLLTLSILVFSSAILFSFYNIRKEGDF